VPQTILEPESWPKKPMISIGRPAIVTDDNRAGPRHDDSHIGQRADGRTGRRGRGSKAEAARAVLAKPDCEPDRGARRAGRFVLALVSIVRFC
jgi:hypothetical protein